MREHPYIQSDDSGNGRVSGVGAILLAAGLGRRFKQSVDDGVGWPTSAGDDKLLAPVAGTGQSVAALSATTLAAAVSHVLGVVRPNHPALHRLLVASGCTLCVAPDAGQGMGASLAAGARWYAARQHSIPKADRPDGNRQWSAVAGVLICLADMPWLKADTIRMIAERLVLEGPDTVVVPTWQGQRGHPVGFGVHHLPALMALTGDTGARDVMARARVVCLPVDDPGMLRDVDRIDDLM